MEEGGCETSLLFDSPVLPYSCQEVVWDQSGQIISNKKATQTQTKVAKSLLNSELLPGTEVAKLLLNLEKLPKIKVAKSLLKSEQLPGTKVAKSLLSSEKASGQYRFLSLNLDVIIQNTDFLLKLILKHI